MSDGVKRGEQSGEDGGGIWGAGLPVNVEVIRGCDG